MRSTYTKLPLILTILLLPCLMWAQGSAPSEGHEPVEHVEMGALPDPAHSAHGHVHDKSPIPPPLSEYQEQERELGIEGVAAILKHRIAADPFNLVASIIFLLAVIHTFLAGPIRKYAHKLEHDYEHKHGKIGPDGRPIASVKAQVLHFFGEIEAIFGLWLIPLMAAVIWFFSFHDFEIFISREMNYTEPMFVVVIMAMASTRPVIKFAEAFLRVFANLGGGTPAAWWLTILIIAPLLGSFITEPAAMTIAAILLSRLFYKFDPSPRFKYATLGLLFVNISVGGTLTHFAAPPVLMVAATWGWDMSYMFTHFGWKAAIGIAISTIIYYVIFRKDFALLKAQAKQDPNYGTTAGEAPVPAWVIATVLGFMAWTVFTLHYPALFIGGFLFFLGFYLVTINWQDTLSIRGPLLVGFFLAALVTHGKLQQWWIAPVLGGMGDLSLFLGSIVLTAFNDNAAITFLASQVPEFANNQVLQHAVVYGAVTGGGLTVIANAPNPAGQSILNRFFGNAGISPAGLLLGALIPTIILGACFWFLPTL